MLRDKIFWVTVAVSLLFHMSMVTLFSIYVWIPVRRPQYYEFDIVDPERHESIIRAPGEELRMPSLDDPLRADVAERDDAGLVVPTDLVLDAPEMLSSSLPEIALPSLDAVQLERSEMIVSSLRIRSAYETPRRQDTWSRFISEIGQLDDRLRNLSMPDPSGDDDADSDDPVPFARPADGVAMYIEWIGEPRDRELLFAAPADSLWRLDARALLEPITIPFKVNAQGEVVFVLAPLAEEDDVLASATQALKSYRFAAVDAPGQRDQYGTLVIAAEANR